MWFRVAKAGSRTIHHFSRQYYSSYYYGAPIHYIPFLYIKYFKFTFVRHPIKRLISAWNNKVVNSNLYSFEREQLKRLQDFNEFVSWLGTIDLDRCDEHLRRQTALVPVEDLHFIGKLENFEEDIKAVLEKLDIENYDIKPRHRGEYSSFVNLNSHVEQKIYELYKGDFRTFKY